jgi:hypothetical protein
LARLDALRVECTTARALALRLRWNLDTFAFVVITHASFADSSLAVDVDYGHGESPRNIGRIQQ